MSIHLNLYKYMYRCRYMDCTISKDRVRRIREYNYSYIPWPIYYFLKSSLSPEQGDQNFTPSLHYFGCGSFSIHSPTFINHDNPARSSTNEWKRMNASALRLTPHIIVINHWCDICSIHSHSMHTVLADVCLAKMS